MWHRTLFFFKWADFLINSHCWCLFPVHVFDHTQIFSIYLQLCKLCDYLIMLYSVECPGVVNEAQMYLFTPRARSVIVWRVWIAFVVPFLSTLFFVLCYLWFDFVSDSHHYDSEKYFSDMTHKIYHSMQSHCVWQSYKYKTWHQKVLTTSNDNTILDNHKKAIKGNGFLLLDLFYSDLDL